MNRNIIILSVSVLAIIFYFTRSPGTDRSENDAAPSTSAEVQGASQQSSAKPSDYEYVRASEAVAAELELNPPEVSYVHKGPRGETLDLEAYEAERRTYEQQKMVVQANDGEDMEFNDEEMALAVKMMKSEGLSSRFQRFK